MSDLITQDERTVKVYSTRGESGVEVQTAATNWGELMQFLAASAAFSDANINNMKAVVGQSRQSLDGANASLPITNFTLFLMPVRTKSGN